MALSPAASLASLASARPPSHLSHLRALKLPELPELPEPGALPVALWAHLVALWAPPVH